MKLMSRCFLHIVCLFYYVYFVLLLFAYVTFYFQINKKYHIDTVSLNFAKKGMEVETYMKDGMITDWDMFEQVSPYYLAYHMNRLISTH